MPNPRYTTDRDAVEKRFEIKKEGFTLRLNVDLHRKLKVLAADRRVSLSALVEELVESSLTGLGTVRFTVDRK
jgi:predicted HicB family RNase H-like nuclease